MEIIYDCPFGSKCEEVKENQVHRCRFYTLIQGKDPQSEKTMDEWNCSLAWLPILLIENAQTNRGQTQALESFRNEMIRIQTEFNFMLVAAGREAAEKKRLTDLLSERKLTGEEKLIDVIDIKE